MVIWEDGISGVRKVAGDEGVKTLEALRVSNPELAEYVVEDIYGRFFERSTLSLRERQIVTITSLLTQGAFEQMNFHIKASLNVGITEEEIRRIFMHCIPYIGVPKVLSAFSVLKTVLEER